MPFPNATDDIHSLFRASLGRSFRFLSFSLKLFFSLSPRGKSTAILGEPKVSNYLLLSKKYGFICVCFCVLAVFLSLRTSMEPRVLSSLFIPSSFIPAILTLGQA